jgi:ATP-binding cassette, subfamily C, bacteriocin exporter
MELIAVRRLACVRQQTPADCGAACLATVALHYGKHLSSSSARLLTGTDQAGASALGLVQGAKSLGMDSKAVRAGPEWLDEVPVPAIAHVVHEGLYHYVVIHRVTTSQVIVADPAGGVRRIGRRDFLTIWTGTLILMKPPKQTGGEGCLPGPFARLFNLLGAFKYRLVVTLLASLFLTISGFAFAFYLQITVDRLVKSKTGPIGGWLSFVLLGIVVCRFALSAARGLLLACLSRDVDRMLIADYYRHLVRLPMSFFQGVRLGDVISRLVDAIKIREMAGGATLASLMDSFCLLSGGAILSLYSWKLTLLTTSLILLPMVLLPFFNLPLRKYQHRVLEHAARLQSHFAEGFAGIETVKALNAEREVFQRMDITLKSFLDNIFKTAITGLAAGSIAELITGAGLTAVLWAAARLVAGNELSIGEMVSFSSILFAMAQPLLRLLQINFAVQDSLVAISRLGELMDLPPEDARSKPEPLPDSGCCAVRFRNVSFRYGARALVLRGINLEIPQNGTTALVGASGSGKSTLVRLLLREYDPEDGAIELGGWDLKGLDPHALRGHFGYVPQDVFIFSGTIAENLCLGSAGVSAQDMEDAVRRAGLDEFVNSLPCRFHTPIGEGGLLLSAGQRQRLGIARMLIRKPRMALLDEPTSQVDAITEQVLLKTIESLAKSMPVLIIAHRLNAVRFADLIAVMENGTIVESGSHEKLLARRSRYFALWQTQFGFTASCREDVPTPSTIPG